jgi:hypothetical protein
LAAVTSAVLLLLLLELQLLFAWLVILLLRALKPHKQLYI